MTSSRKGRLQVEPKPIGQGGQARVYRAVVRSTGTVVAYKRVSSRDPDTVARLRREICVQRMVTHPNIMPVLDHSAKYLWYTMPLAVRVLARESVPVEDSLLLQIVEDCAAGLEAAHSAGCIHRDVTPYNIMFVGDGTAGRWVVSDWGLVRQHGQTTVIRTHVGAEFGTAGFAAPELWIDAHRADSAADVYGLGRVVAWAASGQRPAPNVPLLPSGLWREFVEATTRARPNERVQTILGVRELLRRVREAVGDRNGRSAT